MGRPRVPDRPLETYRSEFNCLWQLGPGGCWVWQKALSGKRGYGTMRINHKTVGAHRVSYELHNGPIPNGLLVRHRCDNPACVNPKHLEVGTSKDNSQDMVKRGRHFSPFRR